MSQSRLVVSPALARLVAGEIRCLGAIMEKPAAWHGSIALRPRLRVTLAADHRAYSGDVGARFLQALTRLLQEPLRLGF